MAVDPPGLQCAFHNKVVSGTTHVVHDFFAAIFLKRLADACAESLEHFVPRGAGPLPPATPSGSFHRIKNAVRVVNLRDGGWALCAEASAACRMPRVAFKLRNLSGGFINIGKKSAR